MTNTYLIFNENNDEVVIIDPTFKLKENIEELLLNNKKIKAILLTHGHLDHIDGIRHINAPIYINEKEKNFIFNNELNAYLRFGINNKFSDNLILNFYRDGDILIEGFDFKVIETSGHTIGSSCFLYEDKYLFTGDTLFEDDYGRTDLPTGSSEKLMDSINKLKQIDKNYIVFPGHGNSFNLKDRFK